MLLERILMALHISHLAFANFIADFTRVYNSPRITLAGGWSDDLTVRVYGVRIFADVTQVSSKARETCANSLVVLFVPYARTWKRFKNMFKMCKMSVKRLN